MSFLHCRSVNEKDSRAHRPINQFRAHYLLGNSILSWFAKHHHLALTTTFIAPLILRDTPGKIIEGVKETFLLKANPAPQIASEFFKLFAGLLLLLPGFLSDFMGLLLWLLSFNPNIHNLLGLSFRFGSTTRDGNSANSEKPEKKGRVIEGESQDLKDD